MLLNAAFDVDVDTSGMCQRIVDYVEFYCKQHNVKPSIKVITLNFLDKQLYEFSEREIAMLVPNWLDLAENYLKKDLILSGNNVRNTVDGIDCELVEKFKSKIVTRADVKKLTAEEQEKIKIKYRSVSVFLKKLKEA